MFFSDVDAFRIAAVVDLRTVTGIGHHIQLHVNRRHGIGGLGLREANAFCGKLTVHLLPIFTSRIATTNLVFVIYRRRPRPLAHRRLR